MDQRGSKEKGMGARRALAGQVRRLLRAGANYSAERFTQTKADCEDALWLARQRLAARPLPALAIVLGIGLVAGMLLAHAWAGREDGRDPGRPPGN